MTHTRALVRGLTALTTLATALSLASTVGAQTPAGNGQVTPPPPPRPAPTAAGTATPYAPPPSVLAPPPPNVGTSSTPGGVGSSRPSGAPTSGSPLPSTAGSQGVSTAPQPIEIPPPPGSRILTLDEAVTIAVSGNVDAKTSELELDQAESGRAGSRGRLLPRITIDGAVQEWDRAFVLPFGGADLTVRDQFTWNVGATLVQPLTGLFGAVADYKAQAIGVDIAKLQHETTRRDVGFQAAIFYLRTLEAKRIVEVAVASVQALDAQAKQAASLHANGVIAKNDLLRAQLALSNAKQREIQARGQLVMARGRLATQLGLPRGLPVDAAPLGTSTTPSEEVTTVLAAETASTRRLEVKAFDARIDQADERISVARNKLLPQIQGVANYTHFDGSEFQQKDAAYIGVTGSWNIWDWGATWSESKDASSRFEQAKLSRVRIEDQVRLEARQAAVDAQSARDALDVAKSAVAQAEENYRIVSRRFEEAAGTAFDVVDAEALLTQSRAQFEQATYDFLVARLALQRATGEPAPHVR